MEQRMAEENQGTQGSSAKAHPADASAKAAAGSKSVRKKKVTDLDMGEASREEGFRLNGCR
jgi:hypothetical protein